MVVRVEERACLDVFQCDLACHALTTPKIVRAHQSCPMPCTYLSPHTGNDSCRIVSEPVHAIFSNDGLSWSIVLLRKR